MEASWNDPAFLDYINEQMEADPTIARLQSELLMHAGETNVLGEYNIAPQSDPAPFRNGVELRVKRDIYDEEPPVAGAGKSMKFSDYYLEGSYSNENYDEPEVMPRSKPDHVVVDTPAGDEPEPPIRTKRNNGDSGK
jgi:hypothetical protein